MHVIQASLTSSDGGHPKLRVLRHLGAMLGADLDGMLSEPLPDELLALVREIEAIGLAENSVEPEQNR